MSDSMTSTSDQAKPALRMKGPNWTADLALIRPDGKGSFEALLIRRSWIAPACPGMMALPGGFIDPSEAPMSAARRELIEETGVSSESLELIEAGVWDQRGRDPRESEDRWAASHLFAALAPEGFAPRPQGLDDAEPGQTRWVSWGELSRMELAFDHGLMLARSAALIGAPDPQARSWSARGAKASLRRSA